jgi:hypothetical protein
MQGFAAKANHGTSYLSSQWEFSFATAPVKSVKGYLTKSRYLIFPNLIKKLERSICEHCHMSSKRETLNTKQLQYL